MSQTHQHAAIYRSLQPDQIRLMRMYHGGDSEIQCSLSSFSLDHCPRYTALSYRWGEDKPSNQIFLGGKAMLVQSNLHDYLKLMKVETQEGWIFIDFLCINQQDIAERSRQVALMGQIYKGAWEVVAWMGMDADPVSEHPFPPKIESALSALQAVQERRGSISPLCLIEDIISRGLISREEVFAGELFSPRILYPALLSRLRVNKAFNARSDLQSLRLKLENSGSASIDADAKSTDTARDTGPVNSTEARLDQIIEELVTNVDLYVSMPSEDLDFALSRVLTEFQDEHVLDTIARRFPEDDMQYFSFAMSKAFLKREYWSRTWIVQEVALSKVLTFRFRSLRLPSQDLQSFVTFKYDLLGVNVTPKQVGEHSDSSHGSTSDWLFNALLTISQISGDFKCLMIALQVLRLRHEFDPSHQGDNDKPLRSAFLRTVLVYSTQECKELYDHYFGILGITNSVLRPNYRMSVLELYLRILIEGLLEHFVIEEHESDDWRLLKENVFCRELLYTLHLNIWQPVVALTTAFVLAKRGQLQLLQQRELYAGIMAIAKFGFDFTKGRGRYKNLNSSVRLRTAATAYLLTTYGPDQYLKPPCARLGTHTYSQWTSMASAIFEDVCCMKEAAWQREGVPQRIVYTPQ